MNARISPFFAGSVYSRCNEVINIGHIGFLYDHSQLMYAFMNQLVTPVFSEEVERAAVTFNRMGRAFLFEVNRDFWNSITFYEQCFVLAHEILHALLDHGVRGQEYVRDLFRAQRPYYLVTEDVLNQMMDIEINESLVSPAYGFDRSMLSFADDSCFVDTVFSEEIRQLENIKLDEKFEYYTDIYLKHVANGGFEHLLNLLFNGMGYLGVFKAVVDGQETEEFDPAKFCIDDEEQQDWEDVMREKEEVLNDFFEDQNVEPEDILNNRVTVVGNKMGAGFGAGSSGNYSVKLEETKSLDDVFTISMRAANRRKEKMRQKETSWSHINRRYHSTMQAIDPDLVIPGQRSVEIKKSEEDKLKVLVYMDTSASCFDYVKKLMELVKALPEEKYEVETYIFAGHVGPIDLNNPRFFSGGTAIREVYDHATQRFEENSYEAVFVLTDGEFANCYDDYDLDFRDWSWFLVPSYDEESLPKESKVHRVKEI